VMSKCTSHLDFFDDSCAQCKREYAALKGDHDISQQAGKERRPSSRVKSVNYKEFTEERAKKLYEELILEYMSKEIGEQDAARRAQVIIRKQCTLRGIEIWPWLK
jgi:hypothetical protein